MGSTGFSEVRSLGRSALVEIGEQVPQLVVTDEELGDLLILSNSGKLSERLRWFCIPIDISTFGRHACLQACRPNVDA